MARLLVDVHLGGLDVVELLAEHGLVARREAGPRLVRAPVVLVRLGHVHVLVEVDHLRGERRRSVGGRCAAETNAGL